MPHEDAPATKAAPKKAKPRAPAGSAQAKSILLFSDGTGNSSAKLFKTNVWRMYEAVDLGLAKEGERVQIAYYDNGVGTSKIKPLAWLGGIFGLGLQRNILAIYRYVCRNYRPGDKIYCFGFSRGAFTIRLVAALLAQRGVVTYRSESELNGRTLDVLRDFQRENKPNLVPWLSSAARKDRDGLIALKRWAFRQSYEKRTDFGGVDVAFVGVWDTVAAYGGPSAEVTRAIDNFIYPLSMTDQYLSERVQVARHALALDDERDSFHPVLWDEWEWSRKARNKHGTDAAAVRAFEQRMQQVWFAGMHSDVGGGYPDESLSFVSLAWMMKEAADAGLRFLPGSWDRVRMMSNSLGPIHNSRSGFASYYRYQPRRLEGFLHKSVIGPQEFEKTRTYRDPVRGERIYPPQGYLLSCNIHESVVARIVNGTDDYAPISVPPVFNIMPFNFEGGGNPRIDKKAEEALRKLQPGWAEQRERNFDRVWWRRLAYFFTVIMSALLLLMPLYAVWVQFPDTVDGQWVFGRLTSWMKALPNVAQPWVAAFQTSPIPFLLLTVAIGIGAGTGKWLETSIRSKMHRLWEKKLAGHQLTIPRLSWVRRLRLSRPYQHAIQDLKWYILPCIVGILMLLGLLYALFVLSAQVRLSINDPGLCARNSDTTNSRKKHGYDFVASEPCNSTQVEVQAQRPYALELAVPTTVRNGRRIPDWSDGSVPASPAGIAAGKLGWPGYLGAPLRRLVDVRYMQVIYQIRPPNKLNGERGTVFVRPLNFRAPDKSRPGCWIYRADFVAQGPGKLFLFANDAVADWDLKWFYQHPKYGNRGVAQVYVHDLHAIGGEPGTPAASLPNPCARSGPVQSGRG